MDKQLSKKQSISESQNQTEEMISEKIYKKIKDETISDFEFDKIISEEIENNIPVPKNLDWNKHYIKERIKKKIKEKHRTIEPTTVGKRFANDVLDIIGVYVLGSILFYRIDFFYNMQGWLFSIIVMQLYYTTFECICAKTPAKFITGTKVVTEYGEKPDFKTIFLRTLIRIVPFEPFSFLEQSHPIGWHDRWSKTIVIDDVENAKEEKGGR